MLIVASMSVRSDAWVIHHMDRRCLKKNRHLGRNFVPSPHFAMMGCQDNDHEAFIGSSHN